MPVDPIKNRLRDRKSSCQPLFWEFSRCLSSSEQFLFSTCCRNQNKNFVGLIEGTKRNDSRHCEFTVLRQNTDKKREISFVEFSFRHNVYFEDFFTAFLFE